MKQNSTYRFVLDPSPKKYYCPNCGKKTFVIFIDRQTGEFLPEYGRCDREVKCGYFRHPSTTGLSNKILVDRRLTFIEEPPSFHPNSYLQRFAKRENNFTNYLRAILGSGEAERISKRFSIGTLKQFGNGTIFWQIDEQHRVRGGKVIRYLDTGKRTKDITWIHSFLKSRGLIKSFHLSQCLFGLHQAEEPNKPVAIVESEKTVCIMSSKFPDFLWMACGSKTGFTVDKLTPIRKRKIIAYPDCEIQKDGLSTFAVWQRKAEEMKRAGFDITVSNLIEERIPRPTDLQGLDLADFFR